MTETKVPSPFSSGNSQIRYVYDASSLAALMKCPRYYYYTYIEGWRGTANVDQQFGGYAANGFEAFKKARLSGKSKTEATIIALRDTLERTWLPSDDDHPEGHPWGGAYEEQWRCTGTEPYRNARGNRAKCPWSHKGKWYPSPAPSICGVCGSPIETQRRWVSDNPAKDRRALVRMVAWWCDDQPEEGGLELLKLPDGTPAVELSFHIVLPWKTPTQEPYILAGYFDNLDRLGEEVFINDNKTTKNAITARYWQQYSPNVQVDIYDLAGSIVYPDLGIIGVRIDAAQTLVGGARFGSQIFRGSEARRAELLEEIEWYIKQAERYAELNYWPMNRTACFTCAFKEICNKDPSVREHYLKNGQFEKRTWNPLQPR